MERENAAKTAQDIEVRLLQEITTSISEVAGILKITSYPDVKKTLECALDSDEKKLAYELSDGIRTSDVIAQELRRSGLSKGAASTVRGWWSEWERAGLISANGKFRRKIFSLRDYGLEVRNTLSQVLQPIDSDSECNGSGKQEECIGERGNSGANNQDRVES